MVYYRDAIYPQLVLERENINFLLPRKTEAAILQHTL